MGVAAFSAGIFSFDDSCFLQSIALSWFGAVIHAMHDEQDIQKMGGLKEYLPVTYKTFLVGCDSDCRHTTFRRIFSKDEILWKAFSSEQGSWCCGCWEYWEQR